MEKLRRVYALWAPVYDLLYERFYRALRQESIARLQLRPGDAVLVVGGGTGSDFPLLSVASVVAIDASPAMLRRSRSRAAQCHVQVVLGDGERLPFRDATFDVAVLHLVLSVTPAGRGLLAEAGRVLRVGGRAAVFDHFAPPPGPSRLRLAISPLAELCGARLDRTFEELAAGLPFTITGDAWRRMRSYRLLQLLRVDESAPASAPPGAGGPTAKPRTQHDEAAAASADTHRIRRQHQVVQQPPTLPVGNGGGNSLPAGAAENAGRR